MNEAGNDRTRLFQNKPFARFARKNEISDADLCKAVQDANNGLISADLGGGVIKQRLARKGSGKSGGFRTLISFKAGERAIFVHGFAKNDVENLRPDELATLKKLAAEMLAYRIEELERAIASGTLTEVKSYGKNEAIS
ncbi:MAG: type II toxin-antitoxin system RelE/ParE family toxin [Terracidiphilus sp.]